MKILHFFLALGFASASVIDTKINNCGGVVIGGVDMTPFADKFTCFDINDPVDLSVFFDNFDTTVSELDNDFEEIDTDGDDILSIDELASFFGMMKRGSSGSSDSMTAAALPILVASIAAIAF